jgi:hypothetical protein
MNDYNNNSTRYDNCDNNDNSSINTLSSSKKRNKGKSLDTPNSLPLKISSLSPSSQPSSQPTMKESYINTERPNSDYRYSAYNKHSDERNNKNNNVIENDANKNIDNNRRSNYTNSRLYIFHKLYLLILAFTVVLAFPGGGTLNSNHHYLKKYYSKDSTLSTFNTFNKKDSDDLGMLIKYLY